MTDNSVRFVCFSFLGRGAISYNCASLRADRRPARGNPGRSTNASVPEMDSRAPVSGYSGFIPGITADNIFSVDYQKSLSVAAKQSQATIAQQGGSNPGYRGESPPAVVSHCGSLPVAWPLNTHLVQMGPTCGQQRLDGRCRTRHRTRKS